MTHAQQYLWILPVSSLRWLWKPFAARAAKAFGLHPLFVVSTPQDAEYYRHAGNYQLRDDQLVVLPDYYLHALESPDSANAEIRHKARAFEQRFGISLMRSMVQADRHLGRGFIWGWNGSPASYAGDAATDVKALSACVLMLEFFEQLIASHPPGLVVSHGGGTGLSGKPVALYCRERGIPFRSLASARFGAAYYWATDEFDNSAALESAISNQPQPTEQQLRALYKQLNPPAAFTATTGDLKRERSFSFAVKVGTSQLIHRIYNRVRGYRKGRIGYKPISAAWTPLRRWYASHLQMRPPYKSLQELPSDLHWVAFPLQFEPEASLQGQSPNASLALSLIYETALSLTANTILVVKEHPLQAGRRPQWFIDCINQLPNTHLLQPSVSGSALLQRCSAVVQINSSFGYEAAALGLPVGVFSEHGPLRAVAHVHTVNTTAELERFLAELDNNSAEAFHTRQTDGWKFINTIEQHGIHLPNLKLPGRSEIDPAPEADQLVASLIADAIGTSNSKEIRRSCTSVATA